MLKEIIISIQSYFEAHRFIVKHRLWKWILIPGLFYCILFIVGMYFFWSSSNSAIEWVLIKSGVKNWLDRVQDNWISFFFVVGQIIFRLVSLLFYFSLFKYFFLIIGSPVFAYLSEKTESIIENRDFPFKLSQLLKDIVRAVKIALRNMLWQSVYLLSILILSFIPVAGWITPLLSTFLDCYYVGFSMLDYTNERKKISASESIELISHHKGLAIGNGMVFYIMHLLPFIGWLLAPSYAVIAATISLHQAKNKNVIAL
jgi:CysZ protein